MNYFKDAQGNLHSFFPEDTRDTSTLTLITEAEMLLQTTATPQTIDQQIKTIDDAIEAHTDAVAMAKGYRNADRCILYTGYPNVYQAECLAFANWRTDCFTYMNTEVAKVQAGTRAMPTTEAAILELPVMVWPV